MITRFSYFLGNLFCSIKVLPEYKGTKLVFRGNSKHYKFIKSNYDVLKKQKLYLYQRQPIDICLEMVKQKTNTITYITNQNYQTVTAIPNNGHKNQEQNKGQNDKDQSFETFMKVNKLYIKKSFLDLHPAESYHKICSFLKVKKKQQVLKVYKYCSFTKNQLNKNTYILPFLKKLRERYLVVEQLKLRKLDRKRDATPQQIEEALEFWRNTYQIKQVYSSKSQQQQFKFKYAVDQNIGEFVKVEDLLQGYGQKSYYAAWINQSE